MITFIYIMYVCSVIGNRGWDFYKDPLVQLVVILFISRNIVDHLPDNIGGPLLGFLIVAILFYMFLHFIIGADKRKKERLNE